MVSRAMTTIAAEVVTLEVQEVGAALDSRLRVC